MSKPVQRKDEKGPQEVSKDERSKPVLSTIEKKSVLQRLNLRGSLGERRNNRINFQGREIAIIETMTDLIIQFHLQMSY